MRVLVAGEGADRKLAFEYIPADPAQRAKKAKAEEDDGEDEDGDGAALVEASPRKALPGPKDKKDRPKSSGGTVPSVPRRKDD